MAIRPVKPASKTSWEPVEKWYHSLVGEDGHYYHRQVILPGIKKLIENPSSLLDLACGTGILSRYLPKEIDYLGIDAAPSLIKAAKDASQHPKHQFQIGDITKPLNLNRKDFSHAAIILALQNLEFPEKAFENAFKHLQKDGKLIMVLNHPCFRVLRQSAWGIDQAKKIQYRRIDRYYSTMKIPITAHPGKEKSESTLSFHHPLSYYSRSLFDTGFTIELIEEWCSDKVSTGGAAKMENRARAEIPLFMAIRAKKL